MKVKGLIQADDYCESHCIHNKENHCRALKCAYENKEEKNTYCPFYHEGDFKTDLQMGCVYRKREK